jgi:hypothetical protein
VINKIIKKNTLKDYKEGRLNETAKVANNSKFEHCVKEELKELTSKMIGSQESYNFSDVESFRVGSEVVSEGGSRSAGVDQSKS